ncbi:tRNA (adenosine(37)-N6)-threonylcarbamoyltransferase complex dimerization subunit type 1 TsaB [Acerihabitans arboris]|uniref:tRNA threonylcarbamoyladenosine biosynthesis protein TsaB n=1 Tax=Acerihabitans arboris TaxID=2691583 RepID=A0A845SCK1_9GAMM|nr:tRNA (adenosine(37)-N6)-threonylcarbamoyltransferase complex dimerization subunit type 1 TsaB [Acerihabitans arboris]NDL62490.1 tRNA (adenosine(37)-N6)-threonylcarbamoyltransferase complex dimerization subunit type 1 TsaB [Acerihabitans arboris]
MSTRILALDTATEACSAALWIDGEISERFAICPREHTRRILPMVDSLLAEAGIELTQLDALAYGRGPGSFTGVRIGIGIAQGLALGAELPMIGVSTLAALAQGAWRRSGVSQVLCAIDARMGEVYWARYRRGHNGGWQGEASEKVLKPAQLAPAAADLAGTWATAGTGWQTYPGLVAHPQVRLVDGHTQLPAAVDMLPLAVLSLSEGGALAVELQAPTYLRNEVTWKKLPGRG